MAETHTREEVLRDLEDRYGRLVAANFKEAIDSVKDQADLQRAVDAIDAGDFDALMEALHVDEAVYNAMLDNLDDAATEAAISRIAGRARIELSGNMTIERVARLADSGADEISVGAITHSAPAADISFEIDT